jgi:hypothetical protein
VACSCELPVNGAPKAATVTIWAPANGGIMCVEGNARMHALALGLVRQQVSDAQALANAALPERFIYVVTPNVCGGSVK